MWGDVTERATSNQIYEAVSFSSVMVQKSPGDPGSPRTGSYPSFLLWICKARPKVGLTVV